MNGGRAKQLRRENSLLPHPQRRHGGMVGKRKTYAEIRSEHDRALRAKLQAQGLIDPPSPTKEQSP